MGGGRSRGQSKRGEPLCARTSSLPPRMPPDPAFSAAPPPPFSSGTPGSRRRALSPSALLQPGRGGAGLGVRRPCNPLRLPPPPNLSFPPLFALGRGCLAGGSRQLLGLTPPLPASASFPSWCWEGGRERERSCPRSCRRLQRSLCFLLWDPQKERGAAQSPNVGLSFLSLPPGGGENPGAKKPPPSASLNQQCATFPSHFAALYVRSLYIALDVGGFPICCYTSHHLWFSVLCRLLYGSLSPLSPSPCKDNSSETALTGGEGSKEQLVPSWSSSRRPGQRLLGSRDARVGLGR